MGESCPGKGLIIPLDVGLRMTLAMRNDAAHCGYEILRPARTALRALDSLLATAQPKNGFNVTWQRNDINL